MPLLLLQLVASGPVGQRGLCHLCLNIRAALGEDEPLMSLFPLSLITESQQKGMDFPGETEKRKADATVDIKGRWTTALTETVPALCCPHTL